MAIVVDHTPSGLTAVVAAGLANAENRRRQEYADKQAIESRQLDIAQQRNDLAQQELSAQIADKPVARQHAADMVRLQYDLLGQRDAEQQRLSIEEERQRADADLSPMQQSQLRKLDENELLVTGSNTLAPVAKEAMLAQIEQKRSEIRAKRGSTKPSPYPAGQGVGDIWNDPRFKVPITRKANGEVVTINDHDSLGMRKPPTFGDYNKAITDYISANSTPERTVPYEQARAAVQQNWADYQRLVGAEGDAAGQGADPSFVGPTAPGMSPSAPPPQSDPAMMQQKQAAQSRAVAGRINQQLEMLFLVPPNHPVAQAKDGTTFRAFDGNEYTRDELIQVALQKKIPIDQLLGKDAAKPANQHTSKKTQDSPKDGKLFSTGDGGGVFRLVVPNAKPKPPARLTSSPTVFKDKGGNAEARGFLD